MSPPTPPVLIDSADLESLACYSLILIVQPSLDEAAVAQFGKMVLFVSRISQSGTGNFDLSPKDAEHTLGIEKASKHVRRAF